MKQETSEGGRQETGYMCVDEKNEGAGRREAWSVRSKYKVKGIGMKGRATTVEASTARVRAKNREDLCLPRCALIYRKIQTKK
jgi:hypothetical protein